LTSELHPYVVFLPEEQKYRTLGAIFGSNAAVDILKFALSKGISNKIYQKDLVGNLNYSNKTIIGNLKTLTRLGIVTEEMEKSERRGRIVWLKAYRLSDAGRWFALLLAEEKDLSDKEKAGILQSLFRAYIKWVRDISGKLGVTKKALEQIFFEEMK
jgi:DNA-binding MarR family transcriptional regulator